MTVKISDLRLISHVGNELEPSPLCGSAVVGPACHALFCISARLAGYSWQLPHVQKTGTSPALLCSLLCQSG